MALRGGLANNGAGFVLWTRALGLVLFGRAFVIRALVRSFRGSCFSVVLFVVRAFGRSFRGSCFGFVFCGSFFWFVLLGACMCFLFDALKFLEACVARSEVSKCKDSKKFAAMQIFTLKISCSSFGFSVVQGRNNNSHKRLRVFVGRRENAFRFLRFIFNLQYVYGMFHCGLHKMFCFIQEKTQLPCVNVVIKVISH